MKKFIIFISFFPSVVFGQWYVFKGDLGNKSITMNVLCTPVGIWGSYFFDENKIPLLFESIGSLPETGNWKFNVNKNSKNSEEFSGVFDKNIFKGTWKSGKKTLSFNLKRESLNEQNFETFSSYDKTQYNPFVIYVVHPQKNHPHYALIQNYVFDGELQNFLNENIEKRKKYYAELQDILSNETPGNLPKDFFVIYPIYLSSKFVIYASYFYASFGMEREGYEFNTISIQKEQPVEIYDIIADNENKLKQVLAEKLSKSYSFQYKFDDISLGEADVYFTEDGVVFAFPSGPFYPGTLRTSFTRKEAEPLLNPFAKEMWNN